jgi:hypothetical protein
MVQTITERPSRNELGVLTFLLNLAENAGAMERIQVFAQEALSDWQGLAQLAADHHLRPWLYKYYRQMPDGLVPGDVLQAYKELIERQRFLQLKLLREFFRIQRVLEKEQIPLVPFKGFRMGHGYYGNPELR